jgi:hypothetical protein
MIMFLRNVLADLEKQAAREGALIGAETPGTRKQRAARMPRAIIKHGAGQQRRASRVSAKRYARRATRLRRANA